MLHAKRSDTCWNGLHPRDNTVPRIRRSLHQLIAQLRFLLPFGLLCNLFIFSPSACSANVYHLQLSQLSLLRSYLFSYGLIRQLPLFLLCCPFRFLRYRCGIEGSDIVLYLAVHCVMDGLEEASCVVSATGATACF